MRIALRQAGPGDEPHLLAVYGSAREDELATTDWDDARKRESSQTSGVFPSWWATK